MAIERTLEVWGEEAPATEPLGREASGETVLAAAVLKRAFEDLEKHRNSNDRQCRRAFRDAYVWVASNERHWPFSFLNVCDMLDVSAATVRAKLLRHDDALRCAERRPARSVHGAEGTFSKVS